LAYTSFNAAGGTMDGFEIVGELKALMILQIVKHEANLVEEPKEKRTGNKDTQPYVAYHDSRSTPYSFCKEKRMNVTAKKLQVRVAESVLLIFLETRYFFAFVSAFFLPIPLGFFVFKFMLELTVSVSTC
jgi:hypothetical protein